MNRRVLVVEHDEELMRQICLALREPGLDPLGVSVPSQALRSFYSYQPSLVLVDVDAPDQDGWEICQRIRELADTPLVITSADAERDSLLRGYELGVDGFITKPFSMREMASKVSAVLHRRASNGHVEFPPPFHSDDLEIDWSQNEVRVRGKKVNLTPTEFKLLRYLAENRSRVLTHEQILSRVWGPEYVGDKSYVKLYIRYLREKIEPEPSKPQWILTERGFGYRFVA